MKVKTQLTQLRLNYGNISDQEISEYTGIDPQQLRELENGQAESIAFFTLAQLCAFFQCTPNDLLVLDHEEEIDTTPPSEETLNQARELIKQGFARADSMTPPEAEEIWNSFEATIQRIGTQLQNSESPLI
jgi:DNA-binding Xre family transcriptional regulator